MTCLHDNWQFDFTNEGFYCPDCDRSLDGTELPEPPDDTPDNWDAWEELLDCIAE